MAVVEIPSPHDDEAMRDLHRFLADWARQYKLSGAREIHYLSIYLMDRCDAQAALDALRKNFVEPFEGTP